MAPQAVSPPVRPARRWRRGLPVAPLVMAAVLASGQAVATAGPEWSGDASFGLWSTNRLLDDAGTQASARVNLGLSAHAPGGLRLTAGAWLVDSPERLDGRRRDAGIRELELAATRASCAPALGRRLVLWGRADGINPTDRVSPVNHRRLTPRDADQRSGRDGLHLDCRPGAGRIQAHLLRGARLNEVPLPVPDGVDVVRARDAGGLDVALRYERLGSAMDWSLVAFDGRDPDPTLAMPPSTAPMPQLVLTSTPMRMLGADLARVAGRRVVRAEAAWVTPQRPDHPATAHRRSHLTVVAGTEWLLADAATLSVQGFVRHLGRAAETSGFPLADAAQRAQGLIANEVEDRQRGLALRYARPVAEHRGSVEVFAVWSLPRAERTLRGRYRHGLGHGVHLDAGFDLFGGPRDSYLGNLRPNSVAFVELGVEW